jgi:hypothetical protein
MNTEGQKSVSIQKFTLGPSFSCLEKIHLYETRLKFYLVGSNSKEDAFRVIKIDRTERQQLVLAEDKVGVFRRNDNIIGKLFMAAGDWIHTDTALLNTIMQ